MQKEKDVLSDELSKPVEDIRETKKQFIGLLSEFDDVFKNGSLEEKRIFVSSVINSILVNDESININWRI